MTWRSDSGSRRPPRAVEPVTSAKRTVTVFRTSRARAGGKAEPQPPQKRKPSGLSCPQLGHVSMSKAYDGSDRRCARRFHRSLVADLVHEESTSGRKGG
jgi:hypothetical protein